MTVEVRITPSQEPRALDSRRRSSLSPMAIPFQTTGQHSPSLSPVVPDCFDCLQVVPESDDFSVDGRSSRTDSVGYGKDSGIECFDDFPIPDDQLVQAIVEQVESYFSDENLSKDAFLLKHIRRNKEGLVSLKLVSSFRKVKALSKNWKVIAHSITTASTKLVINDIMTKVRRISPLPVGLVGENSRSCIVAAYNLPQEKPTVASASQLFGEYGDIASMKIFRSALPAAYSHVVKARPEMNDAVVVIVEFETPDAAEDAVRSIEGASMGNWRTPMRACLVETPKKASEDGKGAGKLVKREKRSNTISVDNPSGLPLRRMEVPIRQRNRAQSSFGLETSTRQRFSPPERSPVLLRNKSNSMSGLVAASPEPSRERYLSFNAKNRSPAGSNERLNRSENLLRQPKGPDGTRGFQSRTFNEQKARSQSLRL